jgi:uncharacterized protein
MKMVIDADGCPRGVLQSCLRIGRRCGIQVYTVASFHHRIESDHHIIVGDASQEADLKVVNVTEKGDLVVTQDWGLAAIVLAKGANCLHPSGREYREETIDLMLEEREMKAKLRRSGGRTKGPPKRTQQDDRYFEHSLLRILGASE